MKEEPEVVSESSSSSSGSSKEAPIVKKRRRPDSHMDDDTPSSVVPGSLKVNGVVRAKAFLQYSDLRLKANVADLADAINIVSQLKGRTYTWKSDTLEPTGGRRVIGLIAQEVKRVLPEVVHENENGLLSVSYAELVPVLIEAFKEQLKQYETDKEDVRQQLEMIRTKLDIMRTAVDREQYIQQRQQVQLNQLQQQNLQTEPKEKEFRTSSYSGEDFLNISIEPRMFVPPVKGIPVYNPEPTEAILQPKETVFRPNFLRIGVIITFILGLLTVTLGAILLGTSLSSPEQMLTAKST